MTEFHAPQQQTAQSSTRRLPSQMTIFEIRASVIDCEKPDPERLMTRIAVCLGAYFDPDIDPSIRAQVRAQYAKALSIFPSWAVARAFDEWARIGTRRPSPADLVILAEREIAPFFAEIRKREQRAAEERAEREAAQRRLVTPEAAQAILEEYGMTRDRIDAVKRFPRAKTMDEAVSMQAGSETEIVPHWSDTAAPDSVQWRVLREARAKNAIMNGGTGYE